MTMFIDSHENFTIELLTYVIFAVAIFENQQEIVILSEVSSTIDSFPVSRFWTCVATFAIDSDIHMLL
jgi:hypothetical protein